MLDPKNFFSQKNPKVQIVFLELLDLHSKKATLPKRCFFKIHQRALSMVKNASIPKTDKTFTLKNFRIM